MKIQQFTVVFELEMSDADTPEMFETALRMVIRHNDIKSCDWLNYRTRRMYRTDVKTIE